MRVACLLFSEKVILESIADACLRFTPQIAIREPDAVFLEIGKSRRLFNEETFLSRLRIILKRFNLNATVEIADSLPHAYTFSKYKVKTTAELPLEALQDFLDPTGSKKELDMSSAIQSLKQLGIQNAGEFLKIPVKQISSRFGQNALICRYRLLDEMNSPWPQWKAPEKITETKEFQYEDFCGDIESLLKQLDSVLDRIFLRLMARSLSVAALKISMDFEKYSTSRFFHREFLFDFLIPQKSKRAIAPLIWERLNKEFSKRPLEAPIQRITLEVLQSAKDYVAQSNFFNKQEEVYEQFNSAIAQLAEEVGRENVFRAKIIETAIPELSWQRSLMEQKELPDLNKHLPQRPTRLLKRPEKVFITDNVVYIRTRPYKILSWSCVEQISTGWIESHMARNYYRLEIEKKPLIWIFKNTQNDYYLHGYFD